jgi:hypothetical protein
MDEDCMGAWEQEHGISQYGIHWQHWQVAN